MQYVTLTHPTRTVLNQNLLMSSEDKHYLWTNSTRSRYFLIPVDQQFSSRDFTIRSLADETQNVDLSAIAPFEISREDAKAHIQAELNNAFKRTREAFATFTDLAATVQGQSTIAAQASQLPKNPLATLLGISQEELAENPDAVKESWQNLVQGFHDVLQGTTSDEPTHLDMAKTRMQQLQHYLQAQGINVDDSIQDLPNKLRKKYHSSQSEPTLEASADKLQEATQKVSRSFNDLFQTLRDSATKVREAMEEAKANHPKQPESQTTENAER